jgi:hypothetical protein
MMPDLLGRLQVRVFRTYILTPLAILLTATTIEVNTNLAANGIP